MHVKNKHPGIQRKTAFKRKILPENNCRHAGNSPLPTTAASASFNRPVKAPYLANREDAEDIVVAGGRSVAFDVRDRVLIEADDPAGREIDTAAHALAGDTTAARSAADGRVAG